MWWPAAAWLAWPIVAATQHLYHLSGNQLRGFCALALSYALGATAAVLLLASWNPGPRRSGEERIGALPVLLVCCVTLSQLVGVILYKSPAWAHFADYAQGVAAVVVALAVSWYAVSLRARALGGVLILGWATITAIWLIATSLALDENSFLTGIAQVAAVLEFVFLAAVLILAVIYMRQPPQRGPGHRAR